MLNFCKISPKSLGASLLVCLCWLPVMAEAQNRTPPFALPEDPAYWLNSAPITSAGLRGKAAFLWFFEETCPRCRAKWPELMALANKYRGQPIVFIAVNSGNPKGVVQQYAREVGLTWPIIVDPLRQFEAMTLTDVPEISLNNISQLSTIWPGGRLVGEDYTEPEAAVQRALAKAAWRVSPSEIPSSLQATWLAVEFRNYSIAAPQVKKSLNHRNPEIKQAAQLLQTTALGDFEKQLAAARKGVEDEQPWVAYRNYQEIASSLKGFDLPEDVEEQLKQLEGDAAVKEQLTALKTLGLIEKAMTSSATAARNVPTRLRKLVEDFPDTEAAARAQDWLDRTAGN